MAVKKYNPFFMLAILVFMCMSVVSTRCYSKDKLDKEIQQLLNKSLSTNAKNELVTAISVSVSLPSKEKIQNYVAGRVSNKEDAPPINVKSLFQIGSVTKSFASAIILQLETEGKLNINQTIGKWLPQYPKWKDVSIKRLLNMTSGILGYFTAPGLLKKMLGNLEKQWSDEEIVDYVYALSDTTKGWNYSDTNYLLIGMIVEKATGHTFAEEIEKRFLSNKKLSNTFYLDGPTPQRIMDRMPEGYFYRKDLFPTLYGKNTANWNMSVARAAGSMVATTEDVVQWVRMLYSGALFPSKQLKELEEIVSSTSGLPIKEVTPKDPAGFGLGVGQIYFPDGGGATWFYEGTTLGYRAYYLYTPCNDIAIAIVMNSSPLLVGKGTSDNISVLAKQVYDKILSDGPEYNCKTKDSNL